MTADNVCAAVHSPPEWERIKQEADSVISHFAGHSPASFVRLGDGELMLLRRRDALAKLLLSAIEGCTILGLPDSFNGRAHPWRAELLGEIPAPTVPVVSAVMPLVKPTLTAEVVRGKRALWITHRADIITTRLRDPAFCRYYGFEEGRNDLHLDCVPPGRTLPYVQPDEYEALLEGVCRQADRMEYDIAVIGMGAMGKMVAHHLAARGRQGFDAGCILSAMRSVVDREVFRRELAPMVWQDRAATPPPRRIMLVLRSGGEYRPSHVMRLLAQLPGCEVSVLTDLPANQFPGVRVIPLKYDWPGWWSKMEMFRPDITGTFLYMDLDTVVRDLPTEFFGHPKSLALGVFTAKEKRDGYTMNGKHGYLQSGLMLLHEQDRKIIWERWIEDPAKHRCNHRGDQDFLNEAGLAATAFQDAFPGQVCSYKLNWQRRVDEHGRALDPAKMRVICFHGQPRPWTVEGPFPGPVWRYSSVVLVGNGPSVLAGEMGSLIDSFEDVVRFNNCKTQGFEKHVGSRTTTWSTVGNMQPPERDGEGPHRALCIVGDGAELHRRPEKVVRIAAHHYGIVRKLIQARSRRPQVSGLIPSSGCLIAWWYLEVLQVPKISIYGFDHFAKATSGQHHYFDPVVTVEPVEHDGEAEAQIIQEFVDAGRIERL